MLVRYELESDGKVIRELTGEVHTSEDLDQLRDAFWSKIRLPWRATAKVYKVR